MTKTTDKNADNYTDKRTGIVYTNVTQPTHHDRAPHEPHLDAFISESFLKNYFDNGPAVAIMSDAALRS